MTIPVNLVWLICIFCWLVSLLIYETTKNKWALFLMWLFVGAQFGALISGWASS